MNMDNHSILIGMDLGTTNLKACAFSAPDGRVLGQATCRLATRSEAGGVREQDVSVLADTLQRTLADVCRQLGDRRSDVRGIGLAAQGGSGAIVSRLNGEPFTPLVLWNDSRARDFLGGLCNERSDRYWQELSQRSGPGMGLARIRSFRQQDPGLLSGERLYVGAGELAYFALTETWRQDACNALQMGCYRVLEDRIDAEPLGLVGLDEKGVAPLRNGHETRPLCQGVADALGLPAGIPVAGPYMDHEAGYLASAQASGNPLQVSLGTAWVGNFVVPSADWGYSPVQLLIPAPTDGKAKLVIQPLLTGNVTWDWALTAFLDDDLGSAIEKSGELFREALLPPDGLVFIPYPTQPNVRLVGVEGGAVFHGINTHVSGYDLLRAVAAGMCYEFYRVFADLKQSKSIDSVVLGGGGSKGVHFQKLLAALFDPIPVFTLQDDDLAGIRGTLVPFSEDVARAVCQPVAVPLGPVRAKIMNQYAHYTRCFSDTYGMLHHTAPYRRRRE